MAALRAKFDGQQIVLPTELRGAAPAEVLIVYPADDQQVPAADNRTSIWDAFGKAPTQLNTDQINAQVRSERDSWGER